MEEYFEIFHKLIKWFGLVPDDIWNMDEMRFKIGYSKA